jgi:predicted nucleotidyltransferase
MHRDSMIEPGIRAQIEVELDRIEREEGARVLFAVESGSRAWGFPSPDSDYDARFVYVRPAEAYLSILPFRDVIERPADVLFDINGWDLRKALQLLCKSNAVVLEWLQSPIRYRWNANLSEALLALAKDASQVAALTYHYDRMARRYFADLRDVTRVPIKKYFYALRPALALRWISDRSEPPPMDFSTLLDGSRMPSDFNEKCRSLVARKATAREKETVERQPILDRFLTQALADVVPRPSPAAADTVIIERANALLRRAARSGLS